MVAVAPVGAAGAKFPSLGGNFMSLGGMSWHFEFTVGDMATLDPPWHPI